MASERARVYLHAGDAWPAFVLSEAAADAVAARFGGEALVPAHDLAAVLSRPAPEAARQLEAMEEPHVVRVSPLA